MTHPHSSYLEAAEAGAVVEFRGTFRFLSNFYPVLFYYNGTQYRSAEAAYQAAKCLRPEDARTIATLGASEAKRMGRRVRIRAVWDKPDVNGTPHKVGVMRAILACKFAQSRELEEVLKLTDPVHLYEGNAWGDRFWGVDSDTWEGENWLGRLLMEVRERRIQREVEGP